LKSDSPSRRLSFSNLFKGISTAEVCAYLQAAFTFSVPRSFVLRHLFLLLSTLPDTSYGLNVKEVASTTSVNTSSCTDNSVTVETAVDTSADTDDHYQLYAINGDIILSRDHFTLNANNEIKLGSTDCLLMEKQNGHPSL
jgi:hypothetical protein